MIAAKITDIWLLSHNYKWSEEDLPLQQQYLEFDNETGKQSFILQKSTEALNCSLLYYSVDVRL